MNPNIRHLGTHESSKLRKFTPSYENTDEPSLRAEVTIFFPAIYIKLE